MQAQTSFFFFNIVCSVKLIENIFQHLAYVLIPVLDLFQELKYPFFYPILSIFVDELISTPKNITFLHNPVTGNEKLSCLSNPIP